MKVEFSIATTPFTDGSVGYNVVGFAGSERVITFACVDYEHAYRLVREIRNTAWIDFDVGAAERAEEQA